MNTLRRVTPVLGVAVALGLAGCQDSFTAPPDADAGSVELAFDMSAAALAGFAVDEARITFQRDDGADPKVVSVSLPDGSAVVEVVLPPGHWTIQVELLDAGGVVGTGAGSALVRSGYVTEVDIGIELATGGVRVIVHWHDTFTGVVADLSDRPVAVEFAGLGTFRVHGLSRIGWDIEVIESPTQGGRSHKDPGVVTFPDIVMLELTSTLTEVQALADWMANPTSAQSISFILVGLGGENARVNVFELVPVDGDLTITPGPLDDYTLAGVRLSISKDIWGVVPGAKLMDLSDYLPLHRYPLCPAPGQRIEIEGVSLSECYPEGVLDVPAVGSSDPLYLPRLRDGKAVYDWAALVRTEVQTLGCADCGIGTMYSRPAISVISVDGAGLEIGRVNLFEVWPSSFTFFDPEEPYGHGYLFGVNIVTDWVEDA